MDARLAGAESFRALSRDLRGIAERKEVLKQLKVELREPLPRVREGIRAAARRDLPARNGLGAWVAKARITASVRVSTSTRAGITLKAGRNSTGARSDLAAIDRGRLRAPSWGKRTKASWHTQTVPAGFMTDTVAQDFAAEWQRAAIEAVDKVVRRYGW